MTSSPPRDAIALFGLPFDLGDTADTTARLRHAARAGERVWFSTANLDWLVMARRDAAFRRSVLDSDLVTMDGAPVAALARLAGVPGASRVAGADLFDALRAGETPLRVFFLGGREGAAERAVRALGAEGGGLVPVGHRNPGYGDVAAMSGADTIGAINDSGADLLVVSLGAAKGQAWIAANRDRLTVPLVSHLGAVVDFAAGTVARAPALVQRLGAEWAWRIGQDPQLWRRYATDAGALPGLLAEARTVRALAAPLASGADGEVRVEDGTAEVVGTPPMDALREALAAGPGTVRLGAAARPSLRTLGTLLLAREAARRAGTPLRVAAGTPALERLCAATLGTTVPGSAASEPTG